MPLEIRPYNEESSDESVSADQRTTTFMDDLRARVATEDEKQRQKWAKSTKPAAPKKPLTPARPDWLDAPKPQKAASPEPSVRSHPKGNHKKKRAG